MEEIGPSVTEFKPGDYVALTVRRPGSSLYDQIGTYDMTTDDRYFERGINLGRGFLKEYLVDERVAQKAIEQAYCIQQRLRVWRPRRRSIRPA